MRYRRYQPKGFSLIELVLYVGISSMLLMGLLALTSAVLESRIKDTTIAEVEQQGAQLTRIMTDSIHNATWVSLPGQGDMAAALALSTISSTTSPTVFDLFSGVVRITEGTNTPIALTSSRVAVSGLKFWSTSAPNTPNTVRFQFLLSNAAGSSRSEYSYQKTFAGSAALHYP
jgi:Tfp pilus assembly protein PilW